MISRRSLGLSGAAFLGLAACGPSETGEPPGEITFAAPATGRPPRRQSDWRPLLADMAAATGLKVRPFFTPNDSVELEALKQRRIAAGWFSNAAAIRAVRSGGGEVFARTIGGANGFRSMLVVRAERPVTLDRLLRCDKTLRYGQALPGSTPDSLAPVAYLFGPSNIEPAKCFKSITTADPAANLAAVANGTLDVAAVDTALLQRLTVAGRPEPAKIVAIWASPPLPEDPILWRKDLDPELKEKLRQFFITDARGDTALARRQRDDLTPLGVGGFEPADDSYLLQAREIEARVRWAEARWSGDAARIEASRRALDAILAARQAVQLTPSGP
ncbi:MAG TPA: phosphate/phosphite/phosphonate ABC transporter substrate-binding protein [Caulobacteraceae bacterium]|nr:phosphate/phosphite/phosphonate ABC transporter substrate-binding protein [Caulobacteraceae bacterium]